MNITRGQKINPAKLQLARRFRREMTPSERVLWQALRRNALGLHFRRQQVIGGFIADFYCASARLVVEVDDVVHARQAQNDRERDLALDALGIRTLRMRSAAIEVDPDTVLRRIAIAAKRSRT